MAPRKKAAYKRAALELSISGLARRHAVIKAFVKQERIPITAKNSDPRIIQARSLHFNLELGRFVRPIEKLLYNFKHNGFRVIQKGRNMWQRAQTMRAIWDNLRSPRALSCDLSRWDAHCKKKFIKILMHKFYLALSTHSPVLKGMLNEQLLNSCYTEFLRYKTDGVMSGDITTALGNCVGATSILIAMIECLEKVLGRKLVVYILDDGDDFVIMGEEEDVAIVRRMIEFWFYMHGHELKVEEDVREFCQVQFCRHRPVWTARGWDLIPDPKRAISSSLSIPRGFMQSKERMLWYVQQVWWMRAVIHNGQPLLGPLFMRLSNMAGKPRNIVETMPDYLRFNQERHKKLLFEDSCAYSYVTLTEAWGITAEEIAILKDINPGLPVGSAIVKHVDRAGVGEVGVWAAAPELFESYA